MTTAGDTDVIGGLEDELRNYGISVEWVDHDADGLAFAYITAFPGAQINHGEMGRACNALIDLAAASWTPKPVEATVLRSEDDVMGTWGIEPEWIEKLQRYELSEPAFSERVLDTVEAE